MYWELIKQIAPFTIIGALVVAAVARWAWTKSQQPHLGQKMTRRQERRIKTLPVTRVDLEIRQLLKEAIDVGVKISDLPALEDRLALVYKNPERYDRFPNARYASAKGKPLPYEGV